MRAHHTLARRIVGLSLLLLALSPFMEPFSTCDLGELFGRADEGVAVAQVKKLADEAPADVRAGSPTAEACDSVIAAAHPRPSDTPRFASHSIPLRI